jgi:hypothetical protein
MSLRLLRSDRTIPRGEGRGGADPVIFIVMYDVFCGLGLGRMMENQLQIRIWIGLDADDVVSFDFGGLISNEPLLLWAGMSFGVRL